MKYRKFFQPNTITYRIKHLLIFCAIVFIMPIIFFLVGNNLYARQLLREKVTASNRTTMELYAKQLDDKFRSLEAYLSNTGTTNVLVREFCSSQNYAERLVYGYMLIEQFGADLPLYQSTIDGMFLYDPKNEIYLNNTTIVEMVSAQEDIQEQIQMAVSKMDETNAPISSQWFSAFAQGQYYLFCIYNLGGFYYGSWSNAERILQELITVPIEGAKSIVLLTPERHPLSSDSMFLTEVIEWKEDMADYYLTGDKETYVVIGETLQETGNDLVALISDDTIQQGTAFFRNLSILVTLVSLFLLFLFLGFTTHEIAVPLRNVSEALKQVGKENLNISLSEKQRVLEFCTVNQQFNRMVKEIRRLKIKVYEEQLQKQKAQLDFLRIQTNPHFFINAMNIVYNYAVLKNIEMVQNMTMSLVKHFRYTLYGPAMVTIAEEIQFIQNYLHLQDLHAAGKSNIILETDIPEELLRQKIPILLIQPFVENSIKYGESQIHKVFIQIEALRLKPDQFVIYIRDFGNGFPPDVLHHLENGDPILRDGKQRIGIGNVKNRLEILYGDRYSLHFSNQEYGGAIVEITIHSISESGETI